jgi:hypothetical protein
LFLGWRGAGVAVLRRHVGVHPLLVCRCVFMSSGRGRHARRLCSERWRGRIGRACKAFEWLGVFACVLCGERERDELLVP